MKNLAIPFALLSLASSAQAGTTAIRNYAEMYETMRSLTGVENAGEETRTYFGQAGGNLPTLGMPREITPEMQFGTTGLALGFCLDLMRSGRGFGDVDRKADKIPNDVKGYIYVFALNFWGRQPSAEESTELQALAKQVGEANSKFAVCGAMLSSPAVWIK